VQWQRSLFQRWTPKLRRLHDRSIFTAGPRCRERVLRSVHSHKAISIVLHLSQSADHYGVNSHKFPNLYRFTASTFVNGL